MLFSKQPLRHINVHDWNSCVSQSTTVAVLCVDQNAMLMWKQHKKEPSCSNTITEVVFFCAGHKHQDNMSSSHYLAFLGGGGMSCRSLCPEWCSCAGGCQRAWLMVWNRTSLVTGCWMLAHTPAWEAPNRSWENSNIYKYGMSFEIVICMANIKQVMRILQQLNIWNLHWNIHLHGKHHNRSWEYCNS